MGSCRGARYLSKAFPTRAAHAPLCCVQKQRLAQQSREARGTHRVGGAGAGAGEVVVLEARQLRRHLCLSKVREEQASKATQVRYQLLCTWPLCRLWAATEGGLQFFRRRQHERATWLHLLYRTPMTFVSMLPQPLAHLARTAKGPKCMPGNVEGRPMRKGPGREQMGQRQCFVKQQDRAQRL